MTIKEYIRYIQQADTNDYSQIFLEYKAFLKKYIKDNPTDVEAVCQLAITNFELRASASEIIQKLEKFKKRYSAKISAADKGRLYSNLAYYYEEEDNMPKCMECLKKAIGLLPDAPNAYDALGQKMVKFGNNIEAEALSLFEKASTLSQEIKYQYNFAVSLFKNGNTERAKDIFEKLLAESENEKLLYAYGVCLYYLGEKEQALAIANELASEELDNDYIDESMIADLYFLCGEYEMHNKMYDSCPFTYYYTADWLAPYFYSLKKMAKMDELKHIYEKVIKEKEEDITSEKKAEITEGYSEQDRAAYIKKLEKERDDIKISYYKSLNSDEKPDIKIELNFIDGCYLLDCPRHQKI